MDTQLRYFHNKIFSFIFGFSYFFYLKEHWSHYVKNDVDVGLPAGVFKHMEINRLKVYPICPSTLPNPDIEEEKEADVA